MRSLNAGDNFYFLFFALLALIFGCAVMQQFYPRAKRPFLADHCHANRGGGWRKSTAKDAQDMV